MIVKQLRRRQTESYQHNQQQCLFLQKMENAQVKHNFAQGKIKAKTQQSQYIKFQIEKETQKLQIKQIQAKSNKCQDFSKKNQGLSNSRIFKKRVYPIKHIRSKTKDYDNFSNDIDLNQTTDSSRKSQNFQSISAKSFCVMIKKTNLILYNRQANVRRQIASITKLMTALTVLKICKESQINISKTLIKVERFAANMEGTTAQLRQGDIISIIDLIIGMLLPSGNDAATVLAQYFGKHLQKLNQKPKISQILLGMSQTNNFESNIRVFIQKMNKLSLELGINNTNYQNPTGLHHYRSYSTANDVALLSSIFLDNIFLKNICSKKFHSCEIYNTRFCSSRKLIWKNTNKLLWKRSECFGLKTGYTPAAGACLASTFRIKNTQLIIVLLNSQNQQQRFRDSEQIWNIFKKHYFN